MGYSDTTEPEQAPETKICLACEFTNRAAARFCGRCGRPTAVACIQCGADNPAIHRYCDICGAAFPREFAAAADVALSSGSASRRLFSRPRARALKPPGKPRFLGLTWDTPTPNWEWSPSFLREWALRNRWELLAIFLLTAVATFLRVYRLGDIPAGFHGDEAWSGLEALRILKEGWIGIQSTSALGQAAGTFYFTALLLHFFDASIFTVRLSMALFGIATVPTTYLLFRLGFGRWVALFAASALTVSYWHVHMSRLTFPVISLPLICALAAAAILWAMRSRSRKSWVIAGALLGLAPYTYFAYPSFVIAAVAVLAAYVYLQRDRLRQSLSSIGLFTIGLLLGLGPAIHAIVTSPNVQTGRIDQVLVFRSHEYPATDGFSEQASFFTDRAWDSLTLLLRNPRFDGTDGTGGKGAVDAGIAILAYIGLAVAAIRWRSPPYLFALLAVLGALAILVISDPSTGTLRRTISAIPWVFGLAGIGAVTIVGLARRLLGNWGRIPAIAALVVALIVGGVWNVNYYFAELSQDQHFKWTFAPDHVDALSAAHSLGTPGTIYFYSGRWSYDYETIRFLYPDSPGINRSREFGTFELTKLDDGPVTFLLIGNYAQEIDRLKDLYPGGETIVDEEPQPRYIVYHLRS